MSASGCLQVPERVRRGSVHPDYLAQQLQSMHLEEQGGAQAAAKPAKFKGGTFKANDDPTLHALPRDLYLVPHKLTAIKVSGCPVRYLGTREAQTAEEDERIKMTLTISPLYNLTEIIVTNGKLCHLPAGLGSLPVLKILDVSRNAISQLPPDIADGYDIRFINVSCNLLSGELPCELLQSRTLEVLRVENNDLRAEHFPEELDLVGAHLNLKEFGVDAHVMEALEGRSPYPVQVPKGKFKGLDVTDVKDHVPTLRRQAQSSSFTLSRPKGDEGRDVSFADYVLVGYRWIELTAEDGYEYADEFKAKPTEIVVKSAEHLRSLCLASGRDPDGQITGPITKVSQIFIDGDQSVSELWPMLELASGVRTVVIRNCGIKEIPVEFFLGKHSLRYIDFSGNDIFQLPISFTECGALRVALFDHNLIHTFPVVPQNLVYLSLNGNSLCVDNSPESQKNPITTHHFSLAKALKRLDMKDNPVLAVDLFPGTSPLPVHLQLSTLTLDRKAVGSTDEAAWPFKMADGKVPTFVEVADDAWLERMKVQKFFKIFGKGVLGSERFAPRFVAK